MNDLDNNLGNGTILHGKSYDYEIVRTLGHGSFGITYLASILMRDESGSKYATVLVAIKEFFMHDINGREGFTVTSGSKAGVYDRYKDKFIKESYKLSKLHHDNIIRVVEAFEANNTVYYAMEYIDGGSLDDLIKRTNGLTELETLKYARQIGEALNFMHSRNIIHLDVKPSNVMLHHEKAVLIDFGLSKQFDEDGNPDSSTTIGGGTAGYAPLEQTNYNGEKRDGLPVSMDIYALGATMFKMLTGRKPPVASDILNEGFPSDYMTEKGISRELIDFISKSMEPLRKNRFQSMEEVLKELDQLLFLHLPDYERKDMTTEVVYGGPIPENFDKPEQKPVENKKNNSVWFAISTGLVITGLIVWMIIEWSHRLSIGNPVFCYWLANCIIITVFAGVGIARSDLYRKFKWLWFGLFIPSLLNPFIWDPNWRWEWVAEIALFTPLFIFSSKISDKIMKMIMALFIIFASLMIFGF